MGLIGICFSRTRPINWSNKYSNSTHYLRASATVVSSNKGQNDFVPKFFNEGPADESHKSLQMKGSISAISDLFSFSFSFFNFICFMSLSFEIFSMTNKKIFLIFFSFFESPIFHFRDMIIYSKEEIVTKC